MADNQELKLQAGAETADQPKRRGRPAKAAKPQGMAPEVTAGEDAVDYRHNAKRKNNPLAGLAAQNRAAEPPKITYAYNPHLPPVLRFDATGEADKIQELLALAQKRALNGDEVKALQVAFSHQQPWLEWAGKREKRGFQVEPVALHIHERVSTQAILRAVQRQDIQRSLFADPEMDSKATVEFYKHDVDWANRLILGDSLQVMTSLARRENLAGQVQMIYMDPPYGIRYASNFQPEIGNRDVKEKPQDLTREPEMVKAYRDTWTLGLHSYLSYLRDRLYLCKELLCNSGNIFVQISDENIHRVRVLMDEVFGVDNFCSLITFRTSAPLGASGLPTACDYLLWYAKDKSSKKFFPLLEKKEAGKGTNYMWIEENNGKKRRLTADESEAVEKIDQSIFYPSDLASSGYTPSCTFNFEFENMTIKAAKKSWRTNELGVQRLIRSERLMTIGKKNRPCFIQYFNDNPFQPKSNFWSDTRSAMDKQYVVQTDDTVIKRCILMTTEPGDLVLDPTCGSGETALVSEKFARRWVTIDTSRVAVSIARQRLLTEKYEYFSLRKPEIGPSGNFVYNKFAYVTLGRIANNSSIDPIAHKFDSELQVIFEKIQLNSQKLTDLAKKQIGLGNKLIKSDIPGLLESDIPKDLKELCLKYLKLRSDKIKEVEIIIQDNAEQTDLVESPVVIKGITRVTGPFTVEAVMPPVGNMGLESESPIGGSPDELVETFGEPLRVEPQNAAAFQDQVIGLLRTVGVDFLGNKHVGFTRLDALQGSMLHAEGEWTLPNNNVRRVAVSIGPRIGNVSDFQVEKALRQANLKGFQDLLFAGFGFDAVAQAVIQENSEELEGVQTHLFLIRPDVVMTDLLKNSAASQLFTAMGLPRTTLERLPNGEFSVQMNGVDIYDPVTNALIPTGADKVAAWFVDSDYDGRCFCITQAFFPDESAWEKLAKALRSTVDEGLMGAFSGTRSLPFKAGKHQRVAVKVIDPRGNEVMAVHRLV
jgi:adenine-specific DNA-methyltransferase